MCVPRFQRFPGGLWLACFLATPTVLADDVATNAAPFVTDTTFLVVQIDADQIEIPRDVGPIGTAVPEIPQMLAATRPMLEQGLTALRNLAGGQVLTGTLGVPVSSERVPAFLFRQQVQPEDVETVATLLSGSKFRADKKGDWVVASMPNQGMAFAKPPQETLDSIEAAFAAIPEGPIRIVLVPPLHVWRTLDELSPTLPPQLGGGPSHTLTAGVRWVAIQINPANLEVGVVIQSRDEAAATAFAKDLPKFLAAWIELARHDVPGIPWGLDGFVQNAIQPVASGDRITFMVNASAD